MSRKINPPDAALLEDSDKCSQCTAKCCHYIALEIDTPEIKDDYENIIWYLLHEKISVFIENGDWYLLVENKCEYLRSDYKCGIYEERPLICRRHSTEDCEFEGDEGSYDHIFRTPDELRAYLRKTGVYYYTPKKKKK